VKPLCSNLWCAQLFGLILISAATTPQPRGSEPLHAEPPLSTPARSPATNTLWEHIVIIGASASAGFTESEPLGGPNTSQYRLNRYIDAAITAPHQPARNLSSTFFFLQPESEAQRQIALALETNPSVVIGVDFLFWFCYGDGPTDQDRALRFETGLKLCERLRCPLVVGDIPDASAALNRMLTSDEMPSPTALAGANRRLREWARTRRNVVVLPLSSFMNAVSANQALSIHGHTIAAGKTAALLQSDRLHPSGQGSAVVAVMAFESLQGFIPPASINQIQWDPTEIFRRASESGDSAQERPRNHDSSAASRK